MRYARYWPEKIAVLVAMVLSLIGFFILARSEPLPAGADAPEASPTTTPSPSPTPTVRTLLPANFTPRPTATPNPAATAAAHPALPAPAPPHGRTRAS